VRSNSREYKKAPDNAGAILRVTHGLLVVASLVQDHSADVKLDRRDLISREKLGILHALAKLLDLSDVRRVNANERTSRDCTVQLRLSSRNLRSCISTGRGEVQVTAHGSLDGFDGRGLAVKHERGTLGVQVGVGVLNKSERRSDVGECEGHVGGGCKKNRGHFIVSFQDSWSIQRPFIVYIIPDRAGKVNTFLVKSLQTVCQPLARVVVVSFPHRHTSIVPEKIPFVSGIIVPG